MKVFYRIIYALFVGILFLYAHRFAITKTGDKYIKIEGKKAFEENSTNKYRFFYAPLGYHKDNETYVVNKDGFTIRFFEVDKVFYTRRGDVKIEEYFYIVVEYDKFTIPKEFPQRYWFRLLNGEEMITYKIYQFRDFPFSVIVDENEQSLISLDEILSNNYNEIEILLYEDDEEEILMNEDISILRTDLKMEKEILKDYKDLNYLESVGIYPANNELKFMYIYYLIMVAFLVLVTITTYLLFFYVPKMLGKTEPSNHFNKQKKD